MNIFDLKTWRKDKKRTQKEICLLIKARTGTKVREDALCRWEQANAIPVKFRRPFFDAFCQDGIALYDVWPELEGLFD